MIPWEDEELWLHHNLKEGDACPFCDEKLVVLPERSFFTRFWPRSWLRCSASACEFALRYRPAPSDKAIPP